MLSIQPKTPHREKNTHVLQSANVCNFFVYMCVYVLLWCFLFALEVKFAQSSFERAMYELIVHKKRGCLSNNFDTPSFI